MSARESMEHLYSCFDTMYRVLGERAPTLTNDAYVVRCYEGARSLGAVALVFREYLADPVPERVASIHDTLLRAIDGDDTGAMVLFALAVVVGPRVLVSLRDAREEVDFDDAALEVLSLASQVLIQEILRVGDVAKKEPAIDDAAWQGVANELSERLDGTGNAESFGISR